MRLSLLINIKNRHTQFQSLKATIIFPIKSGFVPRSNKDNITCSK